MLAAVTALALWLVRLGLRPLDDMAAHRRRDRRGRPLAAGASGRAAHRGRAPGHGAQRHAVPDRGRLRTAQGQRGAAAPVRGRRLARAAHAAHLDPGVRGAVPPRRGPAPRGPRAVDGRIEAEAARMGVLVDDLLLLARLDQGRPLEREPRRPRDRRRRGRRGRPRDRPRPARGARGRRRRRARGRRRPAAPGARQPARERPGAHAAPARRPRCGSRGRATRSCSRWPTTARACRPMHAPARSSASTATTRRGRATPAAPASASRSWPRSSQAHGGHGRRRRRRRRGSEHHRAPPGRRRARRLTRRPRAARLHRMPERVIVEVADRAAWRRWLTRHHTGDAGVWLDGAQEGVDERVALLRGSGPRGAVLRMDRLDREPARRRALPAVDGAAQAPQRVVGRRTSAASRSCSPTGSSPMPVSL